MSAEQIPRGTRRWMTLDEALARQGLSWADASWRQRTDVPLRVPDQELQREEYRSRRRARQSDAR